jgi:hypothetical protein
MHGREQLTGGEVEPYRIFAFDDVAYAPYHAS